MNWQKAKERSLQTPELYDFISMQQTNYFFPKKIREQNDRN